MRSHEATEDTIFLAGQKVLSGLYRHVGSGREILLENEDTLPASLDGQVACYELIHNTWAEIASKVSLKS